MISVELAQQLLSAVETGDEGQFHRCLNDINTTYESALSVKVGELTRQLDDALKRIQFDGRLGELTEGQLPDAFEQLTYVSATTNQAADVVMNKVESILERLDRMPLAEGALDEFRLDLQDILSAMAFQDLTGQVLNKVTTLLRQVEMGMVQILQLSLEHGMLHGKESDVDLKKGDGPTVTRSQKLGSVSAQDEVDDLLDALGL